MQLFKAGDQHYTNQDLAILTGLTVDFINVIDESFCEVDTEDEQVFIYYGDDHEVHVEFEIETTHELDKDLNDSWAYCHGDITINGIDLDLFGLSKPLQLEVEAAVQRVIDKKNEEA